MTPRFQLNYQYTLLKKMITCPSESQHVLNDTWIPKFIRVLLSQNSTVSDKADAGSYLVAELVAEEMKLHATGESIIHPASSVNARTMFGTESHSKDKESLANATLSCGDLNCESLFYFNPPHDGYN